MTAAVGTNVAGLQAQAAALTNQLTAGGVNVAGILGGGAAALIGGTPGTGAPTPTPAGGAGAPATQPVPGTTANGTAVTVLQETSTGKHMLSPATGRDELVTVNVNGVPKMLRFNAAGRSVTNFDVIKRDPIKVNIDDREGVAAGISNLSRVVASRQERVKKLTEAAAANSNENGTINQIDMQLIVQEQATNDHMNGLNKKIFDGVEESISLWLR